MLSAPRLLLALALALAAASCRQADGPTPAPTADETNEIGDIARDMINVVNKDPQASHDLRTDLLKYAPNEAASGEIDSLAKEIAAALAGARLDDQTAQSLAKTLWLALSAKELSERQVDVVSREMKTVLASAGVTEDRAQPIVNRLGTVQKAITENPRRWYQVF